MSTSNLSHTEPLVAVPSLPPFLTWLSEALHSAKAVLMLVLDKQDPYKQTYHQISFPATPLRFSGKSIYTPQQEWNGYR